MITHPDINAFKQTLDEVSTRYFKKRKREKRILISVIVIWVVACLSFLIAMIILTNN
jgi:hypothetical protein